MLYQQLDIHQRPQRKGDPQSDRLDPADHLFGFGRDPQWRLAELSIRQNNTT